MSDKEISTASQAVIPGSIWWKFIPKAVPRKNFMTYSRIQFFNSILVLIGNNVCLIWCQIICCIWTNKHIFFRKMKRNWIRFNSIEIKEKFNDSTISSSDHVNVPNQEITTSFSDSTISLSDYVNVSIRLKDQSSG